MDKTPKLQKLHRWRISHMKGTPARELGSVEELVQERRSKWRFGNSTSRINSRDWQHGGLGDSLTRMLE